MASRTVRLEVTVTYRHESGGGPPPLSVCKDLLDHLVGWAVNNGAFSGDDADLVIEDYTHRVIQVACDPPEPGGAVIELYTDAPVDYDGFSARTITTVGTSVRRGDPVRKVAVDARDYEWLLNRYGSGMYAITNNNVKLADHVRLGDWVLD